ncbi:hypothetical protein WJX79_008315 [Trebouxia sp. C0005]
MQGLGGSFQGPIYCSEITRVLLQHKWPELASVTSLPLLKTVSVRLNCQVAFSVTTFQASHCPGSVMFLLETATGRVLHTGDFRLGEKEQCAMTQHPAMRSATIRVSHAEVVQSAPSLIPSSSIQPCTVLVGIDLVGKEDMLVAIASETGERIGIGQNRLMTVVAAGFDATHFTLVLSSSRISALPRWMVCRKLLAKLNRTRPTLGIKLSDSLQYFANFACSHDAKGFRAALNRSSAVTALEQEQAHQLMKLVPYSDHSSFAELESPCDQHSQVHCWQKVHQRLQSGNKRHRIQIKTGTNKACIISASLSGTLGNPIIIDD